MAALSFAISGFADTKSPARLRRLHILLYNQSPWLLPDMAKTIDERLEALTQTVEILVGIQVASEKRIDKILDAVQQDGENIRSLARIAEAHEHRLDGLEGTP